MKKTNLLVALSIGILASSSGMIQTQAALYTFNVNFSTKEVANFNDFKQTYTTNTYNLSSNVNVVINGSYRFDSCPTAFTLNAEYYGNARVNGTGTSYTLGSTSLPNFICSTTLQTYSATFSTTLAPQIVQALMNDDVNFARLYSEVYWLQNSTVNGRTLYLSNFAYTYTVKYNFDTTYLFNYFLSDTRYLNKANAGSWTFRSEPITSVNYLFTTAGNDEYRLVNTDFLANLGTTRKKYAVDYNLEFFRGESIGASISRKYNTNAPYDTDYVVLGSSGVSAWGEFYDYYFLNSANEAQAIVDAPVFNFTYQDCGSFLALNVGCFINNGLAYITNDAPIISDAITLLNAGIELAAQTFGIIGNFADDNIFGFLILVGFGFIAIKWLLKND